jgi:hypothetical protein
MFIKVGFDAVSLRLWGFVSFGSATTAGFRVFSGAGLPEN